MGFHMHADSFNIQFYGRKRWAIYAPHKMTVTGYSDYESFSEWLEHRRGGKDFTHPTWECIQEPGDLL